MEKERRFGSVREFERAHPLGRAISLRGQEFEVPTDDDDSVGAEDAEVEEEFAQRLERALEEANREAALASEAISLDDV